MQDQLTEPTLLQGKVAIVTGSSTGLGLAMVRALLAAGARVAMVDIKADELDRARAELADAGDRLLPLFADLTKAGDLDRIAGETRAAFGPVDIVVNNAGVGIDVVRRDYLERPVRFWEHGETVTRLQFEVNAIAPFRLCVALVGEMRERGWGRIINVTTSLDTMLRPGFSGYGGSKAAMEANSAVMAADLAGSGVTVNVLVPGGMADTPMVPFKDRAALLRPEVMARPAVWLASSLSNGVTGRRFRASAWDVSGPIDAVVASASDPIAWSGLGKQAIDPPGGRAADQTTSKETP